jgi:pimeloyl-ACP methyl ester carboxylesterase
MNEPTLTHATIQNVRIGEATAGSGDPVVLLHGWGANAGLMWPLATKLAPLGYCAWVLDLPGFGKSAAPPGVWSVNDYAAFFTAWLDHHGLQRVHLIGHSFGGSLGLVLGADYADRLRKMVLIDASGIRTPAPVASRVRLSAYKAVRDGLANIGMKGLSDQLRGWYTDRYGSADFKNAGALRETFIKVVTEDLLPYAARVKPSTLLLWGDADEDTPLSMGRQLEQTIPDAGLHVFAGAGHYSYLERLAETTRIVDYFFKHD